MIASAIAALAALVACGPSAPPAAPPVELVIPPLGQAAAADTSLSASGDCQARVVPSPIDTPQGCLLDERLTQGPGTFQFPCAGDGAAELRFGEHAFLGTVARGRAELHLTTELDGPDSCRWETEQVIRGAVQGGGSSAPKGKLTWSYTERPISLPPAGRCYSACRARAELVLEAP